MRETQTQPNGARQRVTVPERGATAPSPAVVSEPRPPSEKTLPILRDPRNISADEARQVGALLGIDWTRIDLEQFQRGLEVEFEHGARDPETNVTHDNVVLTGKIAWAHLKEFPDYYTRLDRLEAEATAYWASHRRGLPDAPPGACPTT